jgi:hypothetical protein
MKKKEYERPTTQVVQLKQRSQILTGSPLDATRNGYGDAEELNWE